jgi:hypothetical protein
LVVHVFAQNSFEKRQAATIHFSKEFFENPRNLSTIRKKWMKIQVKIVPTATVLKRFW